MKLSEKFFATAHRLVVGVNGAGKTATVGKIANDFLLEKKKLEWLPQTL